MEKVYGSGSGKSMTCIKNGGTNWSVQSGLFNPFQKFKQI